MDTHSYSPTRKMVCYIYIYIYIYLYISLYIYISLLVGLCKSYSLRYSDYKCKTAMENKLFLNVCSLQLLYTKRHDVNIQKSKTEEWHTLPEFSRKFMVICGSKARFHVTVRTQINKSVVYFIVRRNVKFGCSEC